MDESNQVLFGHSIAGMAVLRALFAEPPLSDLYRGEPGDLVERVRRPGRRTWPRRGYPIQDGAAAFSITVGDGEETAQGCPAAAALKPKVEALFREQRMIGAACDLAGRLKAIKAPAPYEIADCAVFPHQDHAAALWPSLGLGIEFAFPR